MYYMKKGIKNKKFGAALAFAFAMIMMLENVPSAATQMVSAIQTAKDIGLPAMGTGIAIILIVAVVALGGINRITKVTDKMVPIMVIVYVIGGLIVLGAHITAIPVSYTHLDVYKRQVGLRYNFCGGDNFTAA